MVSNTGNQLTIIMQKFPFSFIATVLGLMLLALVIAAAPETADAPPKIPLLAMLIVNEFGFIVTAIGVFTGSKTILNTSRDKYIIASVFCCALLSIKFLLTGLSYWPL